MQSQSKLLETLASNISKEILNAFEPVLEVEVSIKKFNPPLGGICKYAAVTVTKQRS